MSLSTYHVSTNYEKDRYNFIKSVEGDRILPYLDKKGIPTIGLGFNLTVNKILTLVLKEFGVNTSAAKKSIEKVLQNSYGNEHALRAALDTEMANLYSMQPPQSNRASFAFSQGSIGDSEMKQVYLAAVVTYETQVDTIIGNIPNSYERIALLSMAYNGLLAKSSLLKQAIIDDDRAEAWYQIRYSHKKELHKRHYMEASLFGLYKNMSAGQKVSEDEAFSIYRMYTRNGRVVTDSVQDMVGYDKAIKVALLIRGIPFLISCVFFRILTRTALPMMASCSALPKRRLPGLILPMINHRLLVPQDIAALPMVQILSRVSFFPLPDNIKSHLALS